MKKIVLLLAFVLGTAAGANAAEHEKLVPMHYDSKSMAAKFHNYVVIENRCFVLVAWNMRSVCGFLLTPRHSRGGWPATKNDEPR